MNGFRIAAMFLAAAGAGTIWLGRNPIQSGAAASPLLAISVVRRIRRTVGSIAAAALMVLLGCLIFERAIGRHSSFDATEPSVIVQLDFARLAGGTAALFLLVSLTIDSFVASNGDHDESSRNQAIAAQSESTSTALIQAAHIVAAGVLPNGIWVAGVWFEIWRWTTWRHFRTSLHGEPALETWRRSSWLASGLIWMGVIASASNFNVESRSSLPQATVESIAMGTTAHSANDRPVTWTTLLAATGLVGGLSFLSELPPWNRTRSNSLLLIHLRRYGLPRLGNQLAGAAIFIAVLTQLPKESALVAGIILVSLVLAGAVRTLISTAVETAVPTSSWNLLELPSLLLAAGIASLAFRMSGASGPVTAVSDLPVLGWIVVVASLQTAGWIAVAECWRSERPQLVSMEELAGWGRDQRGAAVAASVLLGTTCGWPGLPGSAAWWWLLTGGATLTFPLGEDRWHLMVPQRFALFTVGLAMAAATASAARIAWSIWFELPRSPWTGRPAKSKNSPVPVASQSSDQRDLPPIDVPADSAPHAVSTSSTALLRWLAYLAAGGLMVLSLFPTRSFHFLAQAVTGAK